MMMCTTTEGASGGDVMQSAGGRGPSVQTKFIVAYSIFLSCPLEYDAAL